MADSQYLQLTLKSNYGIVNRCEAMAGFFLDLSKVNPISWKSKADKFVGPFKLQPHSVNACINGKVKKVLHSSHSFLISVLPLETLLLSSNTGKVIAVRAGLG